MCGFPRLNDSSNLSLWPLPDLRRSLQPKWKHPKYPQHFGTIQSPQHLLLTTPVCAPSFRGHVDRHERHQPLLLQKGEDNWETQKRVVVVGVGGAGNLSCPPPRLCTFRSAHPCLCSPHLPKRSDPELRTWHQHLPISQTLTLIPNPCLVP